MLSDEHIGERELPSPFEDRTQSESGLKLFDLFQSKLFSNP